MSKNTCENLRLPVKFLEKLPVKIVYTREKTRKRANCVFTSYFDYHGKKNTVIQQTSLKKGLSSLGSLGAYLRRLSSLKKRSLLD